MKLAWKLRTGRHGSKFTGSYKKSVYPDIPLFWHLTIRHITIPTPHYSDIIRAKEKIVSCPNLLCPPIKKIGQRFFSGHLFIIYFGQHFFRQQLFLITFLQCWKICFVSKKSVKKEMLTKKFFDQIFFSAKKYFFVNKPYLSDFFVNFFVWKIS